MNNDEDRILRSREVERLTGLSATTITRLEAEEGFPTRIQLSTRAFGWLHSEVISWVHTRERVKADDTSNIISGD